jgi:hypothetical protein
MINFELYLGWNKRQDDLILSKDSSSCVGQLWIIPEIAKKKLQNNVIQTNLPPQAMQFPNFHYKNSYTNTN